MTRHYVWLAIVAMNILGCGKILKKDERSGGEPAIDATEDSSSSSVDATVSEEAVDTNETKVDKAAMALNGQELYAKLCASCHQTLDKTDIPKAPLAKIKDAIEKQADMAALKDTAAKDLAAIAEALKTVSKGKGNGEEEETEED